MPKKSKGFDDVDLSDIGRTIEAATLPGPVIEKEEKRATGRPKVDEFARDKRLACWVPEDVNIRLKVAAAKTGKPVVTLLVEALVEYLDRKEAKL